MSDVNKVQPKEGAPGEAGLRWAIGNALSNALGSVVDDGAAHIDPFDSDDIDPLVDAVMAVLTALPAPEGYKMLRDSTHDERSWPEDARLENGWYSCTCHHCGRNFTGHKRRVTCKVCDKSLLALQTAQPTLDTSGYDFDGMCKAFERLIEAHAGRNPFHNPVCQDARMALRILRGMPQTRSKNAQSFADTDPEVPEWRVPDGYALVSENVLRVWGKLDAVREAVVYPLPSTVQHAPPLLSLIRAEERERCAKVCEALAERARDNNAPGAPYWDEAAREIRGMGDNAPATQSFADTDPEASYVAQSAHLNCPSCGGSGHVDDARLSQYREWSSRRMLVARLENQKRSGDAWITIDAVMALMSDCNFLSSSEFPFTSVVAAWKALPDEVAMRDDLAELRKAIGEMG